MTFREMAERHGFGQLRAVAPIKPALCIAVWEFACAKVCANGTLTLVERGYDGGRLERPQGSRTWT